MGQPRGQEIRTVYERSEEKENPEITCKKNEVKRWKDQKEKNYKAHCKGGARAKGFLRKRGGKQFKKAEKESAQKRSQSTATITCANRSVGGGGESSRAKAPKNSAPAKGRKKDKS